jgi:choline-glycine betaine transporter
MRAYGWLTVLWGVMFLLRVLVQAVLYQANDVSLLGTTSIVLGLPLTAVVVVVTLWVVSRLHRHRCPPETES